MDRNILHRGTGRSLNRERECLESAINSTLFMISITDFNKGETFQNFKFPFSKTKIAINFESFKTGFVLWMKMSITCKTIEDNQ